MDDRRVFSGILHILKFGCRWCDCPADCGPSVTIYSAGDGLAACLVQSLCDAQLGAVAAQWLFEPILDDRAGADTQAYAADREHYFWKSAANRPGWGANLGQPAGSSEVPRFAVAARCEPLSPTWLGIGSEDLFY